MLDVPRDLSRNPLFDTMFVMQHTEAGRLFARLGIQTYGFLPMQLPKDMQFTKLIHAADERIPVEAIGFGTDAIYRVLERYGAQPLSSDG